MVCLEVHARQSAPRITDFRDDWGLRVGEGSFVTFLVVPEGVMDGDGEIEFVHGRYGEAWGRNRERC